MHRRARRTALLSLLTGGLVSTAFAAAPPAMAVGDVTCTPAGSAMLVYVNYPAVVDFLDLDIGNGVAGARVNGNLVDEYCLLSGGITEVRFTSASGFGAWRISDENTFVTDTLTPVRARFTEDDPVLVHHGDVNTAATWRSTGGTGVDITGDGTADISALVDYRSLTLVGSIHDDTIDLTGNGSAVFQGNTATILGEAGGDALTGGAGSDTIEGGDGDDQIRGWTGGDTLAPGAGSDVVHGRSPMGSADVADGVQDTFVVDHDGDPDVVRGEGIEFLRAESPLGVVVSNGGTDDDGALQEGDTYTGFAEVRTGAGPDFVETTGVGVVDSGEGNDTVVVGPAPDGLVADGGLGTDTLDLSQQTGPTSGTLRPGGGGFTTPDFPMNTAAGFEGLVGGSDADIWTLDCGCSAEPRDGADEITFAQDGGSFVADPFADGADTVVADDVTAGADYSSRTAALSLTLDEEANDGEAGEGDSLSGLTTLIGGEAADTIVGDRQANVLDGWVGDDVVNGRGGDDTLRGDQGADRLTGGSGDDRLLGSLGADTLLGGDGDDLLRGDAPTDPIGGKDVLDGGPGDDDELGYANNDTFTQGSTSNGQDLLVGGAGTDLASYASRGSAVRLSLNGAYDDGASGEGDRLGGDIENLTGGRGADRITGNALANLITGGAGRDTLSGLGGNDTFQSLDGVVDALLGGTGTDRAHRDRNDAVTSVEQRF